MEFVQDHLVEYRYHQHRHWLCSAALPVCHCMKPTSCWIDETWDWLLDFFLFFFILGGAVELKNFRTEQQSNIKGDFRICMGSPTLDKGCLSFSLYKQIRKNDCHFKEIQGSIISFSFRKKTEFFTESIILYNVFCKLKHRLVFLHNFSLSFTTASGIYP